MSSNSNETEVEALRATIRRREEEILGLQTELKIAQSTIQIQKTELELLADVIARDRVRVQAETAVAAQQIAAATTPRQRVNLNE